MSGGLKVVSWNVNGLRSVLGKGLLDYIAWEKPDVLCLQEIKAVPGDLQHVRWPEGYCMHWNPAVKRGYSGTAILAKLDPLEVSLGIGEPEGDAEGRVIRFELEDFQVVACYTPNAQRELTRLAYRTQVWDPAFRNYVAGLARKKPVLFCGDLNCAHTEEDIARPKANDGNSGFTREERANFSALLAAGFVDSWRVFNPVGNGHYTWWSYRGTSRDQNVGWRIDYHCVSTSLAERLSSAFIRSEVRGSDHCPVGVTLR
jgi:exodeoxyribonuclease-3